MKSRINTITNFNKNVFKAFSPNDYFYFQIKFGVTLAYIKAVGILFSILIMLFISGFQGTNILGNFWLVYWTEDPYLKNSSLGNTTEYYNKNIDYLLMYTLLGVIQGMWTFKTMLFMLMYFIKVTII